MTKILVVDDEKQIVDIVKAYLEREGYQVTAAYDGKSALDAIRKEAPDLVVLDLMLPVISGLDVCRTLRASSAIPIIMLTARDDVTDKIIGLELGADDYVTKPFDPKELVSRVKTVLRRSTAAPAMPKRLLNVADIAIDREKRLVRRGVEVIDLTPIEYDIMTTMAEHPGHVYSRMQLLDKIQGDAYEGYERTIDSHIKNLRKKIERDPNRPKYIITVHGVGYKVPDADDA
jgi:two-component system OmpR family response regulator